MKEDFEMLGEATENEWKDWRWHIRHSIRDIETAEELLGVRFPNRQELERTLDRFPMSITPYYLSLVDVEDIPNDPIFKQAFPSPRELEIDACDMRDPLSEDTDSPVPLITHRYPDRVLMLVSNTCSMYCRHCTRKRKVGDADSIPDEGDIMRAIDYVREHPEVRDVLLSGGDPLMLPDEMLDRILSELRNIPHVEIIRIGTRMPVVLPFRITDRLVRMLKEHHPLWINVHFNHPREFTTSSKRALAELADAGIPLGNQSVLLAGVNDCSRIMRKLVHDLVVNRVRPYYLYQCDLSEGLAHFRTPVSKGIEIMESLIGHTSGLAVPRFVVDAPGGGGKIPVGPNYVVSWSPNKVVLRNYEGVMTTYHQPSSYEPVECDLDCENCDLYLNLEGAEEWRAEGIAKLLCEWDDAISLVPSDNARMARRD